MIHELSYAVPHRKMANLPVPVYLELLQPSTKPTILSLHLVEYDVQEVGWNFVPQSSPSYQRDNVRTLVYEYDCIDERLRRFSLYHGDHREVDFRYAERLKMEVKGLNARKPELFTAFCKNVERARDGLQWQLSKLPWDAKQDVRDRYQKFASLLERILEKREEK